MPEVTQTKKRKTIMNDQSLTQKQLDEFVSDVLKEKNLPGLSDESFPDVVAEMTQTLRELIDMAVIDALPQEKLDELNEILEKPDASPQQITKLIEESDVDTKSIIVETMKHFREEYLKEPQQ